MPYPGATEIPDNRRLAGKVPNRPSTGRAAARRVFQAALLFCATALAAPTAIAAQDGPQRVVVFAAASLADALTEAAEAFEAQTAHHVTLSFAGSAALARQIMLGAPADLFISADPIWADALEEAGLVEVGRRHDILANRLVLIGSGPDGPPPQALDVLDLDAILGDGRLAIGLVEAVPAGRYGRAALQSVGLWDGVQDRLAQTDNVRAALALVAVGAAPVGLVYATDARAEPRVHVMAHIAPDTHPPILYPLVDIAPEDHPAENAFHDFLTGPMAASIFAEHGFDIVPQDAP
jgi:molybdate transport system substrate-binding protein